MERKRPIPREFYAHSIAGISIILLPVLSFMFSLGYRPATGDEPRYILYAASIWNEGTSVMPLKMWQEMSTILLGYHMASYPVLGDGTILGHPIYISSVLSPFAAFGTGGLRLSGLIAGAFGLTLQCLTLRKTAHPAIVILSALTAGLSFPLVSYMFTYWIEVFIFLAVSAGLFSLQRAGRSFSSDLAYGAIILLIPFVHLRASVVGAAIFLAFLLRVHAAGHPRRLLPLCLLAATFAITLVGLNLEIYGSIKGSVTTARPPLPSELYDVVANNLVSVKGLFPYAPIWILGYAGLLAGLIHRDRFTTECGLFAILALITSIGVNPGEGWPGRFLVTSIPMLTVGLSYWFSSGRSYFNALIATLLYIPTIANSVVFFFYPALHIENRQSDQVFQFIYDILGHLDPGLFLPVEGIDVSLARWLLFVALILILSCGLSRTPRMQIFSVFVIVTLFEICRVEEAPPSLHLNNTSIDVSIPALPRYALIEFGHGWEGWYSPPTYPTLTVAIFNNDSSCGIQTRPANQIIPAVCARGLTHLTIASNNFDVREEARYRVRVFIPRSLLLRAYWKLFAWTQATWYSPVTVITAPSAPG